MKYFATIGDRSYAVELTEELGEWRVTLDGEPFDLAYEEADRLGQAVVLHDGESYAMSLEGDGHSVGVTLAGYHYAVELEDERERAAQVAEKEAGAGGGVVKAIMPGVVVELLVGVGDAVEVGQSLLLLEAMKMQNEIGAQWSGSVKKILVQQGQAVAAGTPLVEIEGDPEV